VKEVSHPKFYLFDSGIVRAASGLHRDPMDSEERGRLLETYVFHELRSFLAYASRGGTLSYWRTQDGVEVDFVWTRGKTTVAIEVKSLARWKSSFGAGLAALHAGDQRPTRSFAVYLGNQRERESWGAVWPIEEFLDALWAGDVL